MASHQDRLLAFFRRKVEDGGAGFNNQQIKRFSSEVKALGICDLSQSNTQQYIMSPEGAVYLSTLLTHFNFGLLNKLVEIQSNIKGK